MSLIICPDCGKRFSPRAKYCPQCGLPTEIAVQEQDKISITEPQASREDIGQKEEPKFQKAPTVSHKPTVVSNNPNMQKQKQLLWISFALLMVLIIITIILVIKNPEKLLIFFVN